MRITSRISRLLILGVAVATTAVAGAQNRYNVVTQLNWVPSTGNGSPSTTGAACSSTNYGQPYTDLTDQIQYVCGIIAASPAWMRVSGAQSNLVFTGPWNASTTYSAAPIAQAALYSNNWYVSLQNNNLNQNPATATSYWALLFPNTGGGAPSGPAGGALAGSYPDPSLAPVNSGPGSCGDSTHVCQVATNASGQVTTQTPVLIASTGGTPGGATGNPQQNIGGSFGAVSQVFYNQPGDTISSIETECSSACTYIVTVPQTITLASSHTLSSNVQLAFQAGGEWTVNGGFILTIPGNVTGTLNQHFAGSAAISFGLLQSEVPVEWFGAVLYSNASGNAACAAGTDSTAAIQNALNAVNAGGAKLQGGCYHITAALNITASSRGITGVSHVLSSYLLWGFTPSSVLLQSTASANCVNVTGSIGLLVFATKFQDLSCQHSVLPTGTSTGFNIQYTGGLVAIRTNVQDFINGWHIVGSGSEGIGYIENSSVVWCENGLNETTGNLSGFFLDSTAGPQDTNPSFRMRHSFVAGNVCSGPTMKMYDIEGTSINDFMGDGLETAGGSYGIYINYTGSGAQDTAADIHFRGTIMDSCGISCVYINGLPATPTHALSSVEISGGYMLNVAPGSPIVDVESSSGVAISQMQVDLITNFTPPVTLPVQFKNSSNSSFTNNILLNDSAADAILLDNSSSVVVADNKIVAVSGTNLIHLINGSTRNSIHGNVGSGTATNGLVLDAGTSSNMAVGDVFVSGIAAYTDNGTSNTLCELGSCGASASTIVPPYTYLELDNASATVSATASLVWANTSGITITMPATSTPPQLATGCASGVTVCGPSRTVTIYDSSSGPVTVIPNGSWTFAPNTACASSTSCTIPGGGAITFSAYTQGGSTVWLTQMVSGAGVANVAASNCNQSGTLTGVTACQVTNIGGTLHYIPIF